MNVRFLHLKGVDNFLRLCPSSAATHTAPTFWCEPGKNARRKVDLNLEMAIQYAIPISTPPPKLSRLDGAWYANVVHSL